MKTIVVFFENDYCGIWWSVELYWETLRNKQQTGTYSSENETFSKFYYLSTGMSYSNLQHTIRIHRTTIGQFIPEINDTIFLRLKDKYLKVRHIVYIVAWSRYFVESVKLGGHGVVQRVKALVSHQTVPIRDALESYVSWIHLYIYRGLMLKLVRYFDTKHHQHQVFSLVPS